MNAGRGYAAGTRIVDQFGTSPVDSAEHLGTTPGQLNTSNGLASAAEGVAAHAMAFAGPEIVVSVNSGGSAVNLQESYGSGQTPTNWVTHPSGIGYRRPDPAASGSGSSSGSRIISNAPITDSGTSDGSNDEELARLANFDTGGNENPTGTQTAPTARAEQQGAGAGAPGVGPPKLSGLPDEGEGGDGDDGDGGDDGDPGDGDSGDGGDGEDDGGDDEDGDDEDDGEGEGLAPDGYPEPRILTLKEMEAQKQLYGDSRFPLPDDPPIPKDSGPPPPDPAPGSQTPAPQDDIDPDPMPGGGIVGMDDQRGGDWGDDSGDGGGISGYLYNAAQQGILGNYTPDSQRNALGLGAEIGVGLIPGVSTVASARDLSHDVTNWQWTWGHALQTGGDALGLVPFARAFVKGGAGAVRAMQGAMDLAQGVVKLESVANKAIANVDDVGKLAQNARAAASQLARRLGQDGEKAAAIMKNTERIPSATGTAKYRIPDVLDEANGLIGEVKNVGALAYTSQLQDFAAYAKQNGLRFELTVRASTQLSGPLQKAVEAGDIFLNFLP